MIRRRSNPTAIRPRAGFSLLELVIVVAIIATVGALAIPRYVTALNRYRAGALAQRIAADLAFIAADAKAASASRWVWFVPDQWYIAIGSPDPDHTNDAHYLVQTTLDPYRAYILKADFEGYNQFTFDGYGKPDRGGVIVVGSGDATAIITLDKATGKASVQ